MGTYLLAKMLQFISQFTLVVAFFQAESNSQTKKKLLLILPSFQNRFRYSLEIKRFLKILTYVTILYIITINAKGLVGTVS